MQGLTPILLYEAIVGGGGGGGGTSQMIQAHRFNHTISAAFSAGSLTVALPVIGSGVLNNSIIVNYQDQVLHAGVEYTIGTNSITLQFADDPANYGGALYLQIQYIYEV